MATVIPFEERAVARLRERLGAVEEANQDLIAFARGHSGAVSAIHSAVVAALEADSIDALLHVVTQEWPLILGIDAVALALVIYVAYLVVAALAIISLLDPGHDQIQ